MILERFLILGSALLAFLHFSAQNGLVNGGCPCRTMRRVHATVRNKVLPWVVSGRSFL
jgi:hypothetical protein